ncbi:MAG: hypothetical protein FH753_16445 [Firmicutes bacterium]|nr:hypothetical protein [Bacillota bacterium]
MKYLVGLMILIVLITCACEKPTNEEVFYEMQKSFNNLENYSCIADIMIKGNKSSKYYKAIHKFKAPNKYSIKYISAGESEGNMIIYNGEVALLKHPLIGKESIIKDYDVKKNENLFVGYFLKNFITTEDSSFESEIIKDKEYLLLTTSIPGNNKYRVKEKLWIDKETFKPYRMVILDKDNNITTEILYTNFNDRVHFNENYFNIKTNLN